MMRSRRYAAADIKTIVGMDRNTLFYVVKTLGFVEPAEEKARVTYYDFHGLLDLALIQELLNLGITQGTIKKIIKEPVTGESRFNVFYWGSPKEAALIWDSYSENRREYERDGCVLLIQKEEQGFSFVMMSMLAAFDHMKMFWLPTVKESGKTKGAGTTETTTIARSFGHVIIIDILSLVNNVEMLAEERLQSP